MRLHKQLPAPMQAVGNGYVRDEFRRHKSATPAQAKAFMDEWRQYHVVLQEQLSGAFFVSLSAPYVGLRAFVAQYTATSSDSGCSKRMSLVCRTSSWANSLSCTTRRQSQVCPVCPVTMFQHVIRRVLPSL